MNKTQEQNKTEKSEDAKIWNFEDDDSADDKAEFQHLRINAPLNKLSTIINRQATQLVSQADAILKAKKLSPEVPIFNL